MKKQSNFQQTSPFDLRPASREEAGLFYSHPSGEQDLELGTVGHLRLDFGSGGKDFWSTWWPHNGDQFNTPEFREALQQFVEAMRESGPLKDLTAMQKFCGQNGGAITEDGRSYGYIGEAENYRFCLRCTPRPGDYQGYLYCYDLRQQELARQNKLVGRVTYASGERQEFTDPQQYLQTIREELPCRNTTGFRHETLTDDPEVKKAVDDILLDFAGEENPRRACNYGLTEAGKQALRDAADSGRPHTYAWFVMTDCNTRKEQIHRNLTLEEAIQVYQDSDRAEKRIGVTKDGIAMPKRACCLYRVSTKGQVEKDDIPMQKQRCHEFAAEKGWDIVLEYSEKGVSGFKVSAKDRDAIQQIQKDAANGKFDILLVFMFDRLGRKEDETPFVVEWFVNNGIEVWSAEEGQQRFDTHVDKLMNYIRYWQASGESLKTSIRTKTRLGQIVQEGRFRGGSPAYGFRLVKKGRLGKKNRQLYDIEINPEEAPAVKRMFDLTDRYGYGGRKISTILKNEGIVNLRTGEPFHYSTIQHILANIMNAGILRSGETQSEVFPELQIIPLEQFQRVAKAREQRSINYAIQCGWEPETVTLADGSEATVTRPHGSYPRKISGHALLSGNVYCGHCGGRIFATTARKSHHPSDHPERIAIYKCYNRTQHKGQCDGPTTYRAEKVDAVVESILRGIFARAKNMDEKEFLKNQVQISQKQYQQKLKAVKGEYAKAAKELSKWEDLMLASIEGTCVFTPEQVKRRMDTAQEQVTALAQEIESLQTEIHDAQNLSTEILEQHRQILSWAELFDSASIDEKKVIASQLIKAVTLTRNYGIQIEFNISEAQFLNGMEMG